MNTKTRIFLTIAVILVSLGGLLIWESRNFGKLRLIFCDVGQGDGILIISPGGNEVVIDGGPGSKILDCLSKHMPFWDRTIELVVSTHPQLDHFGGLTEIFAKYKVRAVETSGVPGSSARYKKFQSAVENLGAKIYGPHIGDQIRLDPEKGKESATLTVLWPNSRDVEMWRLDPPRDLNVTGIVTRLSYGNFCAYLTADATKDILEKAVDRRCQVLKVAHHGSRTGTSEQLLEQVKGELAVIQVGGDNRYGHPHREVTDLLVSKGIKILRNDTDGTIEVDSDGKEWQVRSEK